MPSMKEKKYNNPMGRADIKNDTMQDIRGMGQYNQLAGSKSANNMTTVSNEVLLSNAGSKNGKSVK